MAPGGHAALCVLPALAQGGDGVAAQLLLLLCLGGAQCGGGGGLGLRGGVHARALGGDLVVALGDVCLQRLQRRVVLGQLALQLLLLQ